MLVVMLLSSLSAAASLMPLQMLSNHAMQNHQSMTISADNADCSNEQQQFSQQDCCASTAKVSCAVSCAVYSAALIPQVFVQIQPLEHMLLISQEHRVQARSVARSVYRPPIV